MSALSECYARREGEFLVIGNSCIRRKFLWNKGHLISRRLENPRTGQGWDLANDGPDWQLPEEAQTAGLDGTFSSQPVEADAFNHGHLRVEVLAQQGGLELKRAFRIYPGAAAIACDFYLRGEAKNSWRKEEKSAGDRSNIEDGKLNASQPLAIRTEHLCPGGVHWQLVPVRFYDSTDHRNTLVSSTPHLAYRNWSDSSLMSGNLLFVHDQTSARGMFMLKEAPCSDVQLYSAGYDFSCCAGNFGAVGLGIEPEDIAADAWIPGYSVATGIYEGGEEDRLLALRSYQKCGRITKPERDEMVLMNTWGDRGQDSRLCESFALRELELGARLGITHFQLDDGWQNGRSSNSAFKGGSLKRIWEMPDYWQPHPERFPQGLRPVVERGRELGIEVCVWFNPSADDSYAHWQDDANVLVGIYKQHGIRTFKIDGVEVLTKTAEQNLRKMFACVMKATGGEAAFNLDVTAGRRYGYHYFYEYGNLFVENRYTDWSNYYPHWTLRNLWMLSRYVPAQRLQMEFLNLWRNSGKYAADDALAPCKVQFDYAFAITMMGQPLAWFEGSNLPEEAFNISPLVKKYREHMASIHAGDILPLGEEPSGYSWTGFQSLNSNGGYVLVFRELAKESRHRLKLWSLRNARIKLTCLGGQGEDFSASVDAAGMAEFTLPAQHNFALYQYCRA